MYFHLSHNLVLLFDKWRGNTLSDHFYFASVIFVVAAVYEFLRSYLKYQSFLLARNDGRHSPRAVAASLLYQINFIVGYGLMLIAMVHSVVLFVAILLGSGVGYFIAQPAYGILSNLSGSGVYHVTQTKDVRLAEIKKERLDTSFCTPDQFTYI
ncbi:probable low affinity copper uptake protein 2 [Dendronephthya gigantea]|uniref:probable low affinity copper uptake protein 2 n=1 Tax=Dendronephthya gigantea TaxID=151771 RepID=UPI00106C2342|nr:probable low affinity copper uptake protein 2 [Dendronephthya gigantea]